MSWAEKMNKQERAWSESVIEAWKEVTGFTRAELRSKSRIESLSYARLILMYLLYRDTTCSTTLVGKIVNRDHSTVAPYALKVIWGRLESGCVTTHRLIRDMESRYLPTPEASASSEKRAA